MLYIDKGRDAALNTLHHIREALSVAISVIKENHDLRKERDEWRDKYNALLNDSLKHGEAMMGNLLSAMTNGAIKSGHIPCGFHPIKPKDAPHED